MRNLKFAFALAIATMGTWYLMVWSFGTWAELRHIEASSANESPFLRAYQPDAPVKHFWLLNQRCTTGSTNTANSDRHYVHHGLYWETTCIIKSDQEREFVDAIRGEISRSLDVTHSQVNISNDTYEYRSGSSRGAVTVGRLDAVGTPEPPGLVNVHIRLTVEEKMSEWW